MSFALVVAVVDVVVVVVVVVCLAGEGSAYMRNPKPCRRPFDDLSLSTQSTVVPHVASSLVSYMSLAAGRSHDPTYCSGGVHDTVTIP